MLRAEGREGSGREGQIDDAEIWSEKMPALSHNRPGISLRSWSWVKTMHKAQLSGLQTPTAQQGRGGRASEQNSRAAAAL